MKRRKSVRGFIHKEFKDYYGCTCRLYESSCIVPQVWLGVVSEKLKDEFGEPDIEPMLLDKKLAKALVKELNYFIKTGKLK